MAAANQVIRVKRSTVPGRVPSVGDLLTGEIAINLPDGKMYFLKDNGTPQVVEVSTSGGSGGSSVYTEFQQNFAFSSAGIISLAAIPANKVVVEVTVTVLTPFDGTPTLSVGDSVNQSSLVATNENNLAVAATFALHPNVSYSSADVANIYFTQGGATQGTGFVTIKMQQ